MNVRRGYAQAARRLYDHCHGLHIRAFLVEIDPDEDEVVLTDDGTGAWVRAWVWVDKRQRDHGKASRWCQHGYPCPGTDEPDLYGFSATFPDLLDSTS